MASLSPVRPEPRSRRMPLLRAEIPRRGSALPGRTAGLLLLAAGFTAACGESGTGTSGPGAVSRIDISPPGGVVRAGEALQLSAVPKDAGGRAVKGLTVSWSSSDTAIVEVSAEGRVWANASGSATVTAAVGTIEASVAVRVPGLRVVRHPAPTDTVGAASLQALVVEVRGADGEPARKTPIRFESVVMPASPGCIPPPPRSTCEAGPGVLVSALTSPLFGGAALDTTDTEGRASVRVKMGASAGAARIVVRVPAISLVDSVGFSVIPGAPTRIVVFPADTAVLAGVTYPLRATVTDRLGNIRPEEASFAAANARVSVADGVLRTLTVGRGLATVRAGPLVDTVRVSVVPEATIAVFHQATTFRDTAALTLVNLDGSGLRRLTDASNDLALTPASTWDPSGNCLVFEGPIADRSEARLYKVELSGAVSQLPPNSAVFDELNPTYSPDGTWVYYSGSERALDYSFWRVRPDGTGLERLTGTQTSYLRAPRVSLSPDGERFVYGLGAQGRDYIRIFSLRTRSSVPLDVFGYGPRWSPTTDLIAFTASQDFGVRVIRPDGTGERAISPPGRRYGIGLEWSRDGKYLLARSAATQVLELIDVETGEAMPLPFTRRLVEPAWKP